MIPLFIKAFLIGFGLSIPTGPVGVLCIKNTLNRSRMLGFVTGLGATLGDITYTIIVVIGLANIIKLLTDYTLVIKIIAFLLLLVLGIYTFFKKVPLHQESFSLKSGFESFVSSFLLVITNPSVLLTFLITFSYLGLMVEGKPLVFSEKIVVILGVLFGSVVRWYVLSTVTHIFRKKIAKSIAKKINKISGIIFISFAVLVLFYDIILKVFN